MMENSHDEILILCWCFDCKKIFIADGNSQIGSVKCVRCGGKNYDFDMNLKYSMRIKKGKPKKK